MSDVISREWGMLALKDAGLIEPVDAASLHSPRQAYKLTPKGRKALA